MHITAMRYYTFMVVQMGIQCYLMLSDVRFICVHRLDCILFIGAFKGNVVALFVTKSFHVNRFVKSLLIALSLLNIDKVNSDGTMLGSEKKNR